MDNDLRKQIHDSLNKKETDELVEIWQTNDHAEWTDMTFDIIREILQERLDELPSQNKKINNSNKLSQVANMSLLDLYFSFDGRISIETYWLKGILPIFVLTIIAGLIEGSIPTYSPYSGVPGLVLRLLIIWPSLALTIKRWHDRDKSGWWILIGLFPIVGQIWAVIETGFLPGTKEPNQYGMKSF